MKKPPANVELTPEQLMLARDFIRIHQVQEEHAAQLAMLKPVLVTLLREKGNFTADGHTIKLKGRKSWKYGIEVKGLEAQLKALKKEMETTGAAKATMTLFPEATPLPDPATAATKPGILKRLTGKA